MIMLEDLVELALSIKESCSRFLGADQEYDHISAGGDTARAVDEAAEEALRRWMSAKQRLPDVVSEESGWIKGEAPGVLFVDPVDGSSNADRGIPFSSVSIAYSRSSDLRDLEIAVVLDIFGGVLYHARRGGGAWRGGRRLRVREGQGTPVIYSPCAEEDPLKGKAGFRKIARRDLGSVALGLALVAEGRIDALVDLRGDLRAVDLAAGTLLVKEAGGSVYLNGTKVGGLEREFSIAAGSEWVLRRLDLGGMERL